MEEKEGTHDLGLSWLKTDHCVVTVDFCLMLSVFRYVLSLNLAS